MGGVDLEVDAAGEEHRVAGKKKVFFCENQT